MENLRRETDDVLVSLYLGGNNRAFDVLLDRHKERLFAYIRFIVRSSEVAEDIFQETFLKAIVTLQRGGYSGNGRFSAWLTRIAHNLIIDLFRQDRNDKVVSADSTDYDILNDSTLSEKTVEDSIVNQQTLVDIRNLVNRLPMNQREVVFMRYYQNLSFKEIASITGVSINTALGRMRYALMGIRRMAEEKKIQLYMI